MLDSTVLGLVALLVILVGLPLFEELTLPGGVSAKMRKQLRDAEPSVARLREGAEGEVGGEAGTTTSDGEADGGDADDLPAYLMRLAEQQPVASMVALRAELEDRLRATYRRLYRSDSPTELLEVVRRLLRDGHLDSDQADLALRLFEIGDQAAHTRAVRPEQAGQAVAYGQTLVTSLKRSAESPRDFEDDVLRQLQSMSPDRIDRRVTLESEILDEPLEADFIVRSGNARILVEARFLRARRNLPQSIRSALLVAYSALEAAVVDAALIVVPDELGIEEEQISDRITLAPLTAVPTVLSRRVPETVGGG